MSIIQRIEIREDGSARATAAVNGVNDALDEQGRAGARASEGLDRAGRSARESGSGASTAAGFWAAFRSTIGGTNEGLGKITQGFQLVGGALGALVGGGVIGGAITAAITAFGQLSDILTDEEGRLRANVEAVRALGEAFQEFKRDIDEAKRAADDFGKAQQSGVSDFARGLGISPDSLSASGFLAGVQQGEDDLSRRRERNRLEAELLTIRSRIADKEAQAADMGLPSFRRDQARGQLMDLRAQLGNASGQYDALRKAIEDDRTAPTRAARSASRPVGGTFFGAGAFASSILAGVQEGAPLGPADDPFARKLAAFEAPETDKLGNIVKPFQAAEAAALAFADARDKAFQYESAGQFFDVVNTSVDAFGQATSASAANAILFGNSFAKGVNTAMKALASQAAAQALWEGAQAVGALALGRPDAAALHWEAAALYTGVAAAAVLGAAASGGLRSGNGGRRGGGGSGAAGGVAEVGGNGGGTTVFAPTIIVGLDGEPIYRRMHQINDDREGSQSQRRFVAA